MFQRPSLPHLGPCKPQCNDRTVTANQVTAPDEVVDICRDLIRIDTSNPGDHSGPGERQAAEYVAAKLAEDRCQGVTGGECIVLFVNDTWKYHITLAQ